MIVLLSKTEEDGVEQIDKLGQEVKMEGEADADGLRGPVGGIGKVEIGQSNAPLQPSNGERQKDAINDHHGDVIDHHRAAKNVRLPIGHPFGQDSRDQEEVTDQNRHEQPRSILH